MKCWGRGLNFTVKNLASSVTKKWVALSRHWIGLGHGLSNCCRLSLLQLNAFGYFICLHFHSIHHWESWGSKRIEALMHITWKICWWIGKSHTVRAELKSWWCLGFMFKIRFSDVRFFAGINQQPKWRAKKVCNYMWNWCLNKLSDGFYFFIFYFFSIASINWLVVVRGLGGILKW